MAAIATLLAGAFAWGPACARASPALDAGTRPPADSSPASDATGTVYRCGDTYSPRPCPGARLLDVDDPRSAAQRRQAEDVAARDKRLAALLEAQRHERDREGAANRPAVAAAATSRRRVNPADCQPSATVACPARAARVRKAQASASSGPDAITFRAPAAAKAR